MTTDYMELARGFANINIKEIAELAQGYLDLAAKYDVIQNRLIKVCGEKVMQDHAPVFQKLADSGD